MGVATDPEKTSAMEKWPVPTNVSELRGFLGLTGYYRKFVPRYSWITKSLTQLLTKKGFYWNEQAQQAFDTLKQAMVNTPVLALPDFQVPFVVETDACATGIGAVLMQQGHPIAYLSKALGVQNSKLSIYEKEFLAVIMAIDHWRTYLQRGPFIIFTDHKSLCALGDQQLGTELQRKAMSKLVGLQFEFRYKRGVDNSAADSLSRVGHLLNCQALTLCQPDWLIEVLHTYDMDSTAQNLLRHLAILSPDNKGYALDNGLIKYKGRLYIGASLALQTKLIDALHNSPVGGHSGMQATYQRLRKLYYWPGMKTAVDNFVRQCQICQQAKPIHTKPAGLLQPLPIPERLWEDLTMDFIESLPRSEGYDTILVVVDRFTKYAHFIPLRHPFTASSVAKVFLDSIIKLHGVPLSIVTDRDKIFTSAMWRDIFTALGSKLSYITAYHPQTDGQSERVNQCVEQYLRCAVYDKPGKWRSWLPMAEFWYNSSYHTSAGCSPFQALYGRVPNFGAMPNVTMADDSQAKDFPIPDSVHLEQLRGHLT